MEEPKHPGCGQHDATRRKSYGVLGGEVQRGDHIVEIDYATLDDRAGPHLSALAEAHQFHACRRRLERSVIDR